MLSLYRRTQQVHNVDTLQDCTQQFCEHPRTILVVVEIAIMHMVALCFTIMTRLIYIGVCNRPSWIASLLLLMALSADG
jgi:hypothetical protein